MFIFLPLIDDLNQLCSIRARALIYEVSKKQNFQMKTTLMQIINDFSMYGMVLD
jgi:hypothetical protein